MRTIILVAAACVAAGALEARAGAQEPAPLFKSSVAVVPISATVRDHRGRPITTLKASDFEVRDNGESRRILAFDTDRNSPLTVAVLIDTSGSMRLESKLASAREVVGAVSRGLRDGVDAVGVFTFDAVLRELHGFTAHPSLVAARLDEARPFGATSLYDAIAETARRLDGRPSGRRAILVLTDGVDTSSTLAPAEVSGRASAIDAPVYVIATVPEIDQAGYLDRAASPNARAAAGARDLARWTGGDLLWASTPWAAAAATYRILAELRQQYVIGVDSAGDGAWRRLEVSVRDRRLQVRARSGYFVGDSRPAR